MDSENPTPNRIEVQWPERPQVIRQTATLAVAIIGWSVLFWAAMTIPGSFDQGDSAAERRRAAATRAVPADSVAPATAEAEGEAGDETPITAEAPTEDAPEVVAESTPAVVPPPAAEPEPEPEPAPAEPTPVQEEPTQVATEPEPEPEPEPTPPPADNSSSSEVMDAVPLPDPLDDAFDEDLGEVSFAADILPIMENRCIKCHGGVRDDGTQRIEEGLNLMTVEDILAGSTWGSVVEPGDVAGSYLYEVVENGDMPDNEPRLLPRELRLIAAWIRQGAPAN